MHRTKILTVLVCSVALIATTACTSTRVVGTSSQGNGPPSHAPAHGHRAKAPKADDVQLLFDSGLGVYVVLDIPDTYYLDGVYFRIDDGGWVVGSALDGPWDVEKNSAVPPRATGRAGRTGSASKTSKSGKPDEPVNRSNRKNRKNRQGA
jgi:hypothetical protein